MSYTEENISNFDNCCKFFEQDFTQKELYNYLENGTIAEKQLACIKIKSITNENEANILMKNLTGVDGKIRETVSFKLKNFIPENQKYFTKREFYDIFLDAIIDINGNICRNTISAISNLCNNTEFCEYFIKGIIERANKVIDVIDNFEYKDRKYITNKEIFKLYWYLETLMIFEKVSPEELFALLQRSAKINEYTIREKTANLLSKLPPEKTQTFTELNFDNNFYVNLALKI